MSKDAEATLLLRIKQAGQAVLDKFVITFGDLIELAKKLGEALARPIEAYREQERATNSLNTAMVNQGVYTKELSDSYLEMAKSLQKVTLYGDEQIVSAQAQLQSFLGSTKITKEMTTAVLDLATAQGMDLNSAAERVGKSISSATNALAREGIAVDVTASKQERLSQVLTGIEKKWGGQAAAAAQGLGVLDQLKVSVDDLYESLGERLAPVITVIGVELNKFAQDSTKSAPLINGLVQVFGFLVKVADTTVMAFENLGISIGALLGTTAAAVDQAVHGQFKMAWQSMKDGSAAADAEVEANRKAHAERMAAIDDALLEKKQEKTSKELAMERQANVNHNALAAEQGAIDQANRQLQNEQELLDTQTHLDTLKDLSLTAQLERINAMMLQDQSASQMNALQQRKREIQTKMTNEELKRSEENLFQFRKAKREAEVADQQSTWQTISTLSSSKSKELAAIGKAAAITQIAIQTPVAVSRALAAFPPPFNFVAAGLVGAAMAVQAAQIAGVPLAEGGIVKSTPGGVPAIIGEGGRDEAVIPLDSPEAAGRLGGGSTVVNFNGPIMGDRSQAREFAIALDRELLRLRRDGESVAFDARIS